MRQRKMKLPIYVIYNGRAVKAVATEDGGLSALEYLPESDAFQRNSQLLNILLFPSASQDLDRKEVTEEEFDAYVSELRRQYRTRKDLLSGPQKSQNEPDRITDTHVKRKKWTLEGYDLYACEFYKLQGEYENEAEAIAAAEKRKKEVDPDVIYVIDPDGHHTRLS